jgi:hypothetical protein
MAIREEHSHIPPAGQYPKVTGNCYKKLNCELVNTLKKEKRGAVFWASIVRPAAVRFFEPLS